MRCAFYLFGGAAMDVVAVLVDLLVALWFVAVIVAIARAWQARLPRPAPLSPEARNQFVNSWHRITARFIDAPREAVQQADALVLSLLSERGRPVQHDRFPKPIREARRCIASESTNGTEALRQAMLHYRSIFTEAIGRRPPEPDRQDVRRREMA
jgi:hypothetical protein